MAGDAAFKIKTLAILYSQKFALLAGNIIVLLAYLTSILVNYIDYIESPAPTFKTLVLLQGHIALMSLFIINSVSIRISEQASIKKFYMRFWLFFFAEYVLYLIAYL